MFVCILENSIIISLLEALLKSKAIERNDNDDDYCDVSNSVLSCDKRLCSAHSLDKKKVVRK